MHIQISRPVAWWAVDEAFPDEAQGFQVGGETKHEMFTGIGLAVRKTEIWKESRMGHTYRKPWEATWRILA